MLAMFSAMLRGVGFAFDDAGAGDQEEGSVWAEVDVGDREAAGRWHVWVNGCGNRLCGNGRYFNFELRRGEKSTAETQRTQRKAED